MIVGMLSDAHGNVEGFQEGIHVLHRLQAERIFFLGDAVGYLPGAGVVDAILAAGVEPIAGNHEAMLLAGGRVADDEVFRLRETRRELGPAGLELVATWPTCRVLQTRIGPVLLVHDSPRGGRRYVYPDTDLSTIGAVPWAAVCMGHTHRAFVRTWGSTTYVNVGSCGLPRDDGSLGSVVTLDTDTGAARIVRYDLHNATRQALDRVGPVHQVVRASMVRRDRPHESARQHFSTSQIGGPDD